jgi:hypothetical protein
MRPLIDTLEDRRLFSFTFTAGGSITNGTATPLPTSPYNTITFVEATTYKVSKTGTLFISTTSKADNVTLQVKNGKILGGSSFLVPLDDSPVSATFRTVVAGTTTKIKRIDISTLGGNDNVTVIADVPVSIRGAAGNDILNVFAPTRTIEGGSGSNTIREGNEAAGDAYRSNITALYGANGTVFATRIKLARVNGEDVVSVEPKK